ncbi:unnamed protein product [Arabis nemorensis]|uniref:Casein kinase II subunit beta n=1 Tax=Arabis nemorensis TaxID=586526 RepID=A0A565C791_9BRAS|nr:unnamed protein product [Arabis nemorensis]
MNELWSKGKGGVESKVEVVESWERMNEIWSEVKGTIEQEVEEVDNWERLNEIWSGAKGTVESKVEVVESWERMNEIWSEVKGTIEQEVEVVESWDRMNEIWSEGKGSVESKVELVHTWERMSEIWSEVKGTIGPEVEEVDNWERLNEIWPGAKGTVESKVEVVDNRDRMNGIWSGTAGEKSVLVGDSSCLLSSRLTFPTARLEFPTIHQKNQRSVVLTKKTSHGFPDEFNLFGLSNQVPYYDHALDLILDEESSSHGEIITEEQNELIESAAEVLYGMIHARYLLTFPGLRSMFNKYYKREFGRCPRVDCRGQHCLPIGLSDIPRASTVKIYCPKCEDVYDPPSKYQGNIDGSYFGTTFTHMFLMNYECMRPEKVSQSYVPRVFGFKLHNLQR